MGLHPDGKFYFETEEEKQRLDSVIKSCQSLTYLADKLLQVKREFLDYKYTRLRNNRLRAFVYDLIEGDVGLTGAEYDRFEELHRKVSRGESLLEEHGEVGFRRKLFGRLGLRT